MEHDIDVITRRGFGEMVDDGKIFDYARVVSADWFQNNRHCKFEEYKLNESMKEHPYHDLTLSEFATLRLMQKNAQDCLPAAEANVEEWHIIDTKEYSGYTQELWENKFGERIFRTIPHC